VATGKSERGGEKQRGHNATISSKFESESRGVKAARAATLFLLLLTFGREAKVFVESCAAVVSIETVARHSAASELSLYRKGQRRLARTRQA
jgi:hypothetical protein